MAAEDRFCISYNGQSNRDNSTIPPSVLVSELSDYVTHSFTRADGITPVEVLTKHRLQGFSPLYFDGSDPDRFFSYDRESCQALEAGRLSNRTTRRFIHEPLLLDSSSIMQIDLPMLRRFLVNPAAAFIDQRLRVKPFNPAEEPDESEPFASDPLSRYNLSQDLVSQLLKGSPYEECLQAARSRGILPPLSAGKAVFDSAWNKSRQFAFALKPRLGAPLEALTVMFADDKVHLHAVLGNCRSGTHTHWRCAGMKGKDRLTTWLEHLLLNIAKAEGYPQQSIMIANDSILELPPLDDAAEIMTDLLNIYYEGMKRPLPFFPETSWTFLKEGPHKAETIWRGDQRRGFPGECDNPAVALCFGSEQPWGDEFSTLAERIYGPLIAAME